MKKTLLLAVLAAALGLAAAYALTSPPAAAAWSWQNLPDGFSVGETDLGGGCYQITVNGANLGSTCAASFQMVLDSVVNASICRVNPAAGGAACVTTTTTTTTTTQASSTQAQTTTTTAPATTDPASTTTTAPAPTITAAAPAPSAPAATDSAPTPTTTDSASAMTTDATTTQPGTTTVVGAVPVADTGAQVIYTRLVPAPTGLVRTLTRVVGAPVRLAAHVAYRVHGKRVSRARILAALRKHPNATIRMRPSGAGFVVTALSVR